MPPVTSFHHHPNPPPPFFPKIKTSPRKFWPVVREWKLGLSQNLPALAPALPLPTLPPSCSPFTSLQAAPPAPSPGALSSGKGSQSRASDRCRPGLQPRIQLEASAAVGGRENRPGNGRDGKEGPRPLPPGRPLEFTWLDSEDWVLLETQGGFVPCLLMDVTSCF